MDSALWERCASHIREAQAVELGCRVKDFASNALTVVARPENALDARFVAIAKTFGTGTVISVEPGMLDWVREHPPEPHFRALGGEYLGNLRAEAVRRGIPSRQSGGVSLCFALSSEPERLDAPAGFTLREEPRAWMEGWRQRSVFDNALGEPGEDVWFTRLERAFVIFDTTGVEVAVTAVANDGNGCAEIGLDVRNEWRGRGLARPVVLAATRWALGHGLVPYYSCNATNIRSHLVAERCGFRALWSVAGVLRLPGAEAG